jgi:hypothetical protein
MDGGVSGVSCDRRRLSLARGVATGAAALKLLARQCEALPGYVVAHLAPLNELRSGE